MMLTLLNQCPWGDPFVLACVEGMKNFSIIGAVVQSETGGSQRIVHPIWVHLSYVL